MANNLVDNTNYGFTEGVPEASANQEPLKKSGVYSGDLNALTTAGFYSVLNATNAPPAPSGGIDAVGWFVINVPDYFGDRLMQFAVAIGASSSVGVVIYGRSRTTSGVWGSWKAPYQN